MKNLKKLSALAISIMMVLSFAGCGDSKDSSKDESSSKSETTTTSVTESTSDVTPSSNTDSKGDEESFKDGVYTTSDYSIELGTDWTESGTISGMAMFTYNGDSVTNINILQENAGGEISAEEYKDAAIEQFEGLDGYEVTDTKSAEINGNDAYKVYIAAEQSSVKLNLIQGYIVNGSDVFVVTFTTSADGYDDIKESAEKIIESFKVL